MITGTPRVTCAYCGSSAIAPYCRRTDVDLHGFYDCCRDCGVYFANPMAGDDELAAYYATYYAKPSGRSSAQARRKLYDDFSAGPLRDIRRLEPAGRYLEIGCGEGASLAAARDAGYETVGIDLAGNAIDVAREVYGLDARQVRVEDLQEPDGAFDIVYTWHTIEHVTNLRSFLGACARLLRPGGVLLVGTENPEGLFHFVYAGLHRLSGRPIPLNSSSTEHTFLTSPRFLREQLPAFGLRVLRVRAFEYASWIERRVASPSPLRRVAKATLWGTLGVMAHLTNTGALLQVEARRTPR